MISINESVISLTEAAKSLPKRRGGRQAHVATLYRWARRGLRGVKLETIQIGGTLCTSHEALQRFFDRLTEEAGSSKSTLREDTSSMALTPDQVERQLDRAKL